MAEEMRTGGAVVKRYRDYIDWGCWLILAVIVLQLFCFIFGKIADSKQYGANASGFEHVDFLNIYMAGTMLRSDDRWRVYDPAVQLKHYNDVISPAKIDESIFFPYPPYVFLLATPLTFLSVRDAFLLFDLSTVAFGLAGLFAVLCQNSRMAKLERIVFLIAAFGCFPSVDNIRDGHFAWLFVGLFAFYYWAFLRKSDLLAGTVLGIMTFKPHYFLFLLFGAAVTKRFKIVIAACVTLLLLIVAGGVAFGWDNVFNYPFVLRLYKGEYPERMICLRGPISLFLPHNLSLWFGGGCFFAGAIATVYCWYQAVVRKAFSVRWAMALTIIILLVASPHTLVYDATLMTVAAALTLSTTRVTRLFAEPNRYLRTWNALLILYPTMSWLIMILPVKFLQAVFANSGPSVFAVNGNNYGLIGYSCYLLVHLILLVAGSIYALSGAEKDKVPAAA